MVCADAHPAAAKRAAAVVNFIAREKEKSKPGEKLVISIAAHTVYIRPPEEPAASSH
jgi:hypothetical protein